MAASTLQTPMDLFFRCERLKDADVLSKSDPYIEVVELNRQKQPVGARFQTETVKNNLSPSFQRSHTVPFRFEERQEFVVRIMDDDGTGRRSDDKLGEVKFVLSAVAGARQGCLCVPIPSGGKLYVTGQEQSSAGDDTMVLKFHGSGLKNMDTIGKSDPYFKLSRLLPGGQKKLVFKSPVIDNNLNPHWPATPQLRVADLAAKDPEEKSMIFECFDEDTFSDEAMGFFSVSLQDLLRAKADPRALFKLNNSKGKFFGDITLAQCEIMHVPTFVDLLRKGLQLNLAVSIDFTGSNGDPRDSKSLHFLGAGDNQYVRAIKEVGEILMDYDSDKQVAAFGFGANIPNMGVSHFFNLPLVESPYVAGVGGILEAYYRCVTSVSLAGPTNFGDTIRNVGQTARQHGEGGTYTVLLIITDGVITDMDRTIQEITKNDDIPLSIIIVGVGKCDFEAMNRLDGDGGCRLRNAAGVPMKRDIVQFVPFRNFANQAPGVLAAEVLREVPPQVVSWAKAFSPLGKPTAVPSTGPAQA